VPSLTWRDLLGAAAQAAGAPKDALALASERRSTASVVGGTTCAERSEFTLIV